MNDPDHDSPNPPPLRWPKYAVAFAILGVLLWVGWMVKFIHQTRASKGEDFFVPINTNPLPIHAAPPGLFPVPPQTNLAQTNR